MANLVLDVSATISWLIPDEFAPSTQKLLHQVIDEGATVPLIWPIEAANALLIAARRGRISLKQRKDALRQLATLQISADEEPFRHVWDTTLELADQFRLTLYDATYLELAHRLQLPLATLDKELRAAGNKLGLELLGA